MSRLQTADTAPMITIGLTCYNAEDTIERGILGALEQSWPNVEILVVDDCSTDGSWALLLRIARDHPAIRIIRHEENTGVAGAINTLVEAARGTFLAIFDDDDRSHVDRLAHQYQRLTAFEAEHPQAMVLCYSNRDVVPVGSNVPGFRRLGIGRRAPEPSGPIVADFILGLLRDDGMHCWGMFGSCTLMARVSTFREVGSFDRQFRRCAELDFAIRAAQADAYFISVDRPLITQFLTIAPEKSGDADLRYRLLMAHKHKAYLSAKGAYRGALARTRAWFAWQKGRRMQAYLWRAISLVQYNPRVTLELIKTRRRGRSSHVETIEPLKKV